jgi:hypothetical protein
LPWDTRHRFCEFDWLSPYDSVNVSTHLMNQVEEKLNGEEIGGGKPRDFKVTSAVVRHLVALKRADMPADRNSGGERQRNMFCSRRRHQQLMQSEERS